MADSPETRVLSPYEVVQLDCRQHYRWLRRWSAFYTVLLCALVTVNLLASDPATKHATLIGAVGAGLGILGLFIHLLTGTARKGEYHLGFFNIFDTHLRRHLRGNGEGIPNGAGSEDELRSDIEARAELERLARHWANRLLSPVVVTALSLFLWLVFDEPLFALFNEVIGLVLTQAQHYTMPSAALEYMSIERGV